MADHHFWEMCAQSDPLWAILSDPAKKGRRWDMEAFFETGRREISLLLYQLKQLGKDPRGGRALDFGCGVGRLTQALAECFPEVTGVDVSPTMLRLAHQLNRHSSRVRYIGNDRDDLNQFASDSFDFIYSDIVLQHVEPPSAVRYIQEFLRLLRPAGVLVFQLPSHAAAQLDQMTVTAMPDELYQIRLEVPTPVDHLVPDSPSSLLVRATNVSSQTWRTRDVGPIRIGNHWFDSQSGKMLIQDDGRASLPEQVEPHVTYSLTVPLRAPKERGLYICEVDAVHEGVSWFADKGGRTVRFDVDVGASRREAGTAESVRRLSQTMAPEPLASAPVWPDIYATLPPMVQAPAEFPMFGVPKELVDRAIRDSGGQVFHVEVDERCGREWVGYKYFATK